MSTQPKALRLADEFDNGEWISATGQWREEAAAELRRLHVIEEAAKNLVKVKGRYHTEQAFNKLQELLK